MSAKVTKVVVNQAFVAQTASLGTVTLYSVPADGDFRVSVYMDGFAGSHGITADADVDITWTDDIGSHSTSNEPLSSNGDTNIFHFGARGHYMINIHAVASTNIVLVGSGTYDTDVNYNVYVVVEEL